MGVQLDDCWSRFPLIFDLGIAGLGIDNGSDETPYLFREHRSVDERIVGVPVDDCRS